MYPFYFENDIFQLSIESHQKYNSEKHKKFTLLYDAFILD